MSLESLWLNADALGVAIVSIALVLSLYSTRLTFLLYKDLGTEFFRYGTYALTSLSLMIGGYYFPSILVAEEYKVIVETGLLIFGSFGLLAFAFLIHALEYVKKEPNESIINIAFLLSGGLAGSRFLPGQYWIEWFQFGWQQHYGMLVLLLSVVEFIFIISTAGPTCYHVLLRIRRANSYRKEAIMLLTAFVLLFAFFGLFTITYNILVVQLTSGAMNYYLLLILISGFISVIARLLTFYPTIFFASNFDIFEILMITKVSKSVEFRHRFRQEGAISDSVGISLAQINIQQIFNEALERAGDVRSIRVENVEVQITNGEHLYGLLITRMGSAFYQRLLEKSVAIFECSYREESVEKKEEFGRIIENLFQFSVEAVT